MTGDESSQYARPIPNTHNYTRQCQKKFGVMAATVDEPVGNLQK